MKMQTTVTVVGMKSSKGTMDNGQAFDSTKAYVLTDLDSRKGTAKGQGAAEVNLGDSTEFEKFKHLPFPFQANADVEIVIAGSSTRMLFTNLKPVAVAKA